MRREGREPLPDHAGESPLLLRSGGEKGLRGSGARTLGVPLRGTPRVGGILGVAGRLSGTVSPFRAEQGTSLETPWRARASSCQEVGTTWFFSSCGGNLKLRRGSQAIVTQSYLTLCDPKDCSLSGSSVHGICQAGILEWGAISFSKGSSQPRDQTHVSCFTGGFFTC